MSAHRSRPRVSVIVTCFNVEKYIVECLDSVVGQTLENLEIIVVDDGSTDSTSSIIERYATSDPRVVPVLMSENSPGGVATAANVGLEHASGDFVGFVDGDDFCRAVTFEHLADVMERSGSELAMSQFELFHEGTIATGFDPEVKYWKGLNRERYQLDLEERKRFLRLSPVPWRKMYRREFLEANQIRFPEVDYFYEDVPFHWFCLLKAESVALIPEVLFFHRIGRPGQTESAADERLLRMFDHHGLIRQWLSERDMLQDYDSTLLAWVLSQLEGVGRQCQANLRRKLFDLLIPILELYENSTIEIALSENEASKMMRGLTMALVRRDFAQFDRLLQGPPRPSSPISEIVFHLRFSGLLTTVELATGRLNRKSIPSQVNEAQSEWRHLRKKLVE